jgi:hypothetical protein
MPGVSHAMGELLAQIRPGVTTPVVAFTGSELRTEITLILATIDPTVVLGTVGQTDIAMYQDDSGGSTFDQTTIIFSETRLQLLQENIVFQSRHPGSGIFVSPGGELAVEIADANDVTFSIYGITETLAERVRAGVR